ncbi:MAG: hypothetical protein H0V92_13225 [Pseudonocardiales bacterium]|nr:hypothetical protein [Pseudonocardiales bacterium]
MILLDAELVSPATAAAESGPDIAPTAITFDEASAQAGSTIHFDSGVVDNGGQDSGVFNIKWFVDNREVGAYGSHESVAAGATVLDGNSQFDWSFDAAGSHTVEFRLDVDNNVAESREDNNSVSVQVAVADRGGNSGTDPTFVCVRGPNGGCNGVPDSAAPTGSPTWNDYLGYLDGLYGNASGAEPGVSCTRGVATPNNPRVIFDCLGLLAERFPPAGPILDGIGCGITKSPESCVGISLDLLHGVVQAIRGAAEVNAALATFLRQPMY